MKFSTVVIALAATLSPLFFLPFFPSPTTTPKLALLVLTVVLLIANFGTQIFVKKSLTIRTSRLTAPLTFLLVALGIVLLTTLEGRGEALAGKGVLYLGSVTLAFFLTKETSQAKHFILTSILAGTGALAVLSLLHLTALYNLTSLPPFMQSRTFSTSGSPLAALTLFLITIPPSLYLGYKSARGVARYFYTALSIILVVASVSYLSLMLPGGELTPILLPFRASWFSTLEILKSLRTALFGVGFANFSSFFTTVKPLFLNSTPFWNLTPASASSELLHIVTTGGLLTLVALVMAFLPARSALKNGFLPALLLFVGSLVAFMIVPASIPSIIFLFLSLGMAVKSSEPRSISLSQGLTYLLAGGSLALAITLTYFYGRHVLAENHLYRADVAKSSSDGQTTYEEYLKAISLSPQISSYHLSYSLLNLQLAAGLSQKSDITESDRSTIATLISQAVREAKLVTNLRPSSATAWTNLGSVYRQLINVAGGADQYAIDNYARAVSLDPANPALRVEYGGLFYQLAGSTSSDKPEEKQALLARAYQEFTTAVQLKSDYANAYYNLSKVLESSGNIAGAHQAMQKVVALLDPTTTDYATASSELDALKEKLPATTSATPQPTTTEEDTPQISEPSPLPSPLPGGPIILPEETSAPSPTPSL